MAADTITPLGSQKNYENAREKLAVKPNEM
jgi:hypothetical protein